jgi:hypothetical protein
MCILTIGRTAKAAVVIAAAMLAVIALTGVAAKAAGSPTSGDVPIGPVRAHPVTGTPHLAPTDNPAQQIRQIVQCKSMMFAVGSFTTIEQGRRRFARTDVISFRAKAPYTLSHWAPKITGVVNSITFRRGTCADAYIGGHFQAVNGTRAHNIAEISTRTGAVIRSFGHSANGVVETLRTIPEGGGQILAGGYYTSINGSTADPYMTSLNPVTGKDDRYLNLHINGNYEYPGVAPNPTRVYNQALSHSGKLDLVMGDFTSVGNVPRQQIFMLTLGSLHGRVTGWTSPEFDGSDGNLPGGYAYQCYANVAFYIRAADWSPNDSMIYLATTGYHPWNLSAAGGLCDTASAWPATQKPVLPTWINYTGCDSLYSVAADASTVYFAGHERWSENPLGCDDAGQGAISAPGIEGLSPKTGNLTFNPTRSRGIGADDMLITPAGLWIASDNSMNSNMCGGVKNLAGICLLPY